MNRIRQLITSDIPFARDDAYRMLPIMVACLVGFSALLFSAAWSMNHALDSQSRNVAGSLQVEVPQSMQARVKEVVSLLQHTAGVKRVQVLRSKEMEKLLTPWLGDDFSTDGLPLPTLLEVETTVADGKSAVDRATLRKQLTALDTNIRLSDQGPWVSQLATVLQVLQSLILIIALLLLVCVTAMVILVSRTNLKLHFKTVGLLHMFGATDDYILRQFQWNSAALVARGALIGTGGAALIFTAMVVASMRMQSPVIPEISLSISHVLTFLLLPILAALIALVATRLTVQSMLDHMH